MSVGGAATVPGRLPLTTLVSWLWIAQTIEVDNVFEATSTRRGLSTAGPERRLRLTAVGLEALDAYRHQAARAEDTRRRAALEAVVAQPRSLSTGLVPPEGCWRGERPYVGQTKRMVADPTGALPWHPMVLHRGGWPDAS